MLTTSNAADKKTCPIRSINAAAQACVGEHCMLWRRKFHKLTNIAIFDDDDTDLKKLKQDGWVETRKTSGGYRDFIKDSGLGYCGLGPEPER